MPDELQCDRDSEVETWWRRLAVGRSGADYQALWLRVWGGGWDVYRELGSVDHRGGRSCALSPAQVLAQDLQRRPHSLPPLDGRIDLAILGAGYTDLWTIYYRLKRDSSLRAAIIERVVIGFGTSGCNGGWVTPGFRLSLGLLIKRDGADVTRCASLRRADADTAGGTRVIALRPITY